jgi:hypothetical protein
MSFEQVPDRVHKSRLGWGLSIGKTGITLWMPMNHWMEKSPCVITQIGKIEDAGKLRLLPATEGRKVNLANKTTAKKSYFIKYSTLTGAPSSLPMCPVDVLEEREGLSVTLRLPWARVVQPMPPVRPPGTGYSMMDRR